MQEELLMEFKILGNTMNESKKALKKRLDDDPEFVKSTEFLSGEVRFGEIINAITKTLTQKQLTDMTDKEMLKHIHKIQVLEKE